MSNNKPLRSKALRNKSIKSASVQIDLDDRRQLAFEITETAKRNVITLLVWRSGTPEPLYTKQVAFMKWYKMVGRRLGAVIIGIKVAFKLRGLTDHVTMDQLNEVGDKIREKLIRSI